EGQVNRPAPAAAGDRPGLSLSLRKKGACDGKFQRRRGSGSATVEFRTACPVWLHVLEHGRQQSWGGANSASPPQARRGAGVIAARAVRFLAGAQEGSRSR